MFKPRIHEYRPGIHENRYRLVATLPNGLINILYLN